MKIDSILVGLAAIMFVLALVGLILTYGSKVSLENWLTGLVTDEATVNVTVQTNAAINFTIDNIDFGTGQVNQGASYALMDTASGNVVDGTFPGNRTRFILENIGNLNVSLNLSADKTAATFIGGSAGGGPLFQYNVTNNETGSCTPAQDLGAWYSFTTSLAPVCNVLEFKDGRDTINIDILLRIPSDSMTGSRSAIITATAEPTG